MKFGSLALSFTMMVGSVVSMTYKTDIYYNERDEKGPSMWIMTSSGLKLYSPNGEVMKKEIVDIPGCPIDEEGEPACTFFDMKSDGHKYVYGAFAARSQGASRIDVFDIDTGDYVTYMPTCETPLDLDYHPNTYQMWVNCAGKDETDGHIDRFFVNALHAEMETVDLGVTDKSRHYGRMESHSAMSPMGYVSHYFSNKLYQVDLAVGEMSAEIPLPLSQGSYELAYSPKNKHIFVRVRVSCTCGFEGADLESCGRFGAITGDVLTGPNAGTGLNISSSTGACEGSPADSIGVYEIDTKTNDIVGQHNILEGTGFGAEPYSSPDGEYIVLLANDGGQNIRVIMPGDNGAVSTEYIDVLVDFEGGRPGTLNVNDFAFMNKDGKTIMVVGSKTDNNVALVDMDASPPFIRKIRLTQAEESTGGGNRQVEWAHGTDYVWINGGETDEAYVIEVPDLDVARANLHRTITVEDSSKLMFVKNYMKQHQIELLKEHLELYYDITRPPGNDPEPELPNLCFSGANTVDVLGRGLVTVDELAIGDEVLVEGGNYAKVYSFGHYDPHSLAEFLQIRTSTKDQQNLELTPDHMVFVHSNEKTIAVPASQVKVGDYLVGSSNNNQPIKVDEIRTVQRRGAYAPFTMTGDIVVSGVVASNYVSLTNGKETTTTSMIQSHMQWIAHAVNAPHRLVCALSFSTCKNETYNKEGVSNWIALPLRVAKWFTDFTSETQMIVVAFAFPSLVFVSWFENAMMALNVTGVSLAVVSLGYFLSMNNKISKKA